MTTVTTTDPRTGRTTDTQIVDFTAEEVDRAVRAAIESAASLRETTRARRSEMLHRIADLIDASATELATAAGEETGLTEGRLRTEIARSSNQFRLFADVIMDGHYLEAAIDHATADGAGPDIRRMLVPVGPIAVFGASNFPFAFSILGGDTASALAAGCPVVAKAHPAHPLTSLLSMEVLRRATAEFVTGELPVQIVFGMQAGQDLARHPGITAVTLTGSINAARAIQAIIDEREHPVPFYGELGSINPLMILPGAAETKGDAIADGLFASFTGSSGQLCTKPGIAYLPQGNAGDRIEARLREQVEHAPAATMLTEGMRDSFNTGLSELTSAGATLAAQAAPLDEPGFRTSPTLLAVNHSELRGRLVEECFGPVLLVARYSDPAELTEAIRTLPAALTFSLHTGDGDESVAAEILPTLTEHAGRIIVNEFPTGVRVSWAQHHGGPWPSTNSLHTSVGATAIRRFLRPVAFQNVPETLLPEELTDNYTGIPRRVDGVLVPAA
jgi:NADP-dependent aldehyde dehydrogenase